MRNVLVDLVALLCIDLAADLLIGCFILGFMDGGADLLIGGLADVLVDSVINDLTYRGFLLITVRVCRCCQYAQCKNNNLKNKTYLKLECLDRGTISSLRT